ncbi:hypothetical protein IAU60_000207 [Kwoniella sp. DSM 27419]
MSFGQNNPGHPPYHHQLYSNQPQSTQQPFQSAPSSYPGQLPFAHNPQPPYIASVQNPANHRHTGLAGGGVSPIPGPQHYPSAPYAPVSHPQQQAEPYPPHYGSGQYPFNGLANPHYTQYQGYSPALHISPQSAHPSLSPLASGSPIPYSQHAPQQPYLQPTGAIHQPAQWQQQPAYPPTIQASPVRQTTPIPQTQIPEQPATPSGPTIKLRIKPPTSAAIPSADMVSSRAAHAAAMADDSFGSSSGRPRRGASQRATVQMSSYVDQDEDDEEFEDPNGEEDDDDAEGEAFDAAGDEAYPASAVKSEPVTHARPTRSTRASRAHEVDEDDFEDKIMPSSQPSPEVQGTRRSGRARANKVVYDPDEESEHEVRPSRRKPFPPRIRTSISSAGRPPTAGPSHTNGNGKGRATRAAKAGRRSARHSSADGEDFEPTEDSQSDEHISSDPLGNYEDEEEEEEDLESISDGRSPRKRQTQRRAVTRSAPSRRTTRSIAKRHDDSDEEYGVRKRSLRERTSKVNYQLPTLDDLSKEISLADAMAAAARPNGRPGGAGGLAGGVRFGASAGSKGLPWSTRGKDLAQAMGDPDTSDSDVVAPMTNAAAGPSMTSSNNVQRTNAVGPSDVPNFGRINPKSNMADADPLGVDMNVTFDNVGGLDDHINQLKEMVALPLLYPELFQQFGITPPRGVLFHGPPGTGKTLLARALAASCSTGNTKIAFFMRKGADVLSKWVGEAERQLRMLFEEARACQPSIIFFDEIDGIAPVRSSKQDQIHASLVSTLLALMDGMDGRGQVIVIGATNRPDAVDPALRRPGRFDREFYFPLPNRAARQKIIQINTRKWEPQLSEEFLDRLAALTKGYGGADLRALCTEAALNAIQRRYPQIYKTADRLLLETGSIHVSAKDFMISIKKIVPSSARSTSSAAVQLPAHLVPLLSAPLDRLRTAIDHVLPPRKQATALEEAEYEEEEGDSFEKHMMLQSLDKLRTFRPRILVHGEAGMGQTFIGPAILHHLEGFHVQSFDLGTLMGDSTRSVEAAVIQLIVEAKRHQPSIIFVPSLSAWASTMSETARATIRALLDGMPPSDPILLLGVSDAPAEELPGDLRALFGFAPENKIQLKYPTRDERVAYFADLLTALKRPPTEFPGVLPRRKRILETLPIAPPLPPRPPTQAELLREEEKDQAARDMLFQSFVHLVRDFIKRYRKVASNVKDQAAQLAAQIALVEKVADIPEIPMISVESATTTDLAPTVDEAVIVTDPKAVPPLEVGGIEVEAATAGPPKPEAQAVEPKWHAHSVDIDTLQTKLLKHKYYTPADFLADIAKIEENAARAADPDQLARITEMASGARYHVQGFDQKWIPEFERYKERMLAKKAEKHRRKGTAVEDDQPQTDNVTSAPAVQGDAITAPATGQEGAVQETDGSSLKRVREDGETEQAQGREKRSREDDMEVDVVAAAMTAAEEATDEGDVKASGPSDAVAAPAVEPADIPEVPPPMPAHPPFDLPASEVDHLASELTLLTSTLNIDQLEQLRASLFDIIWRGRGDWDRTEVIRHMRERLVQWGQEVEKYKGADRW